MFEVQSGFGDLDTVDLFWNYFLGLPILFY